MALTIALGLLVYSNSLKNPFIWDDRHLVEENPQIRYWSNLPQLFRENIGGDVTKYTFYRPLQMVTYTIEYPLWGLKPGGYRLTNILIHIAAAIGIMVFVFQLSNSKTLSLATAVLFVVHPAHTEAVGYISGRADPLMALFIFLSLIVYKQFLDKHDQRLFALSLASLILALFSKEYASIVPVLILAYHYAFSRRLEWGAFFIMLATVLLFLTLRALGVLGDLPQGQTVSLTPAKFIPGFFFSMTEYTRILLFPFGLHMGYGQKLFQLADARVLTGVGIVFSLLFLAPQLRRRHPLASFAILWFFLGLLPVSNILYPLNATIAEHWLYVPSVGFFLLTALVWENARFRFAKPHRLLVGLAPLVFIVGVWSIMTVKQNEQWFDPFKFYKRILHYNPSFWLAHYNLGVLFQEQDDRAEAVEHFEKALQIDPDHVPSHTNLGGLLGEGGKYEEALIHLERAVAIDPEHAKAHVNLGNVLLLRDRRGEAIKHYEKALEIEPDNEAARQNLATARPS